MTAEQKDSPVKIFISYSHNSTDRPLLDQLIQHLSPLAQAGKISLWEDSQILPGGDVLPPLRAVPKISRESTKL